MKVTMRLEGAALFEKNLAALPEAVRWPAVLEMLIKAAEPMRARAAAMVPRGPDRPVGLRASGHLADNIVIGKTLWMGTLAGGRGRRSAETETAIAVGPQKDYYWGIFLEYGTRRMKTARSFMRPAFDGEAQGALDSIQADIWAALLDALSAT